MINFYVSDLVLLTTSEQTNCQIIFTMASFNELLFDSDSDDEYFMGFETEEINNNDTTYNIDGDIELSDDELRAIRQRNREGRA